MNVPYVYYKIVSVFLIKEQTSKTSVVNEMRFNRKKMQLLAINWTGCAILTTCILLAPFPFLDSNVQKSQFPPCAYHSFLQCWLLWAPVARILGPKNLVSRGVRRDEI